LPTEIDWAHATQECLLTDKSKPMGPSFPPVLAVLIGVLAAGLFTSAFAHWMALLHTTLAKHGGSYLGPPGRRLLLAAPFVFLLHPVPYLIVALLAVSTLATSGVVTRSWWWFLGPFYAYFAFMAVILAKVSVRQPGAIRTPESSKRIWPFDVMERRRYRRQYRAAWAVFLVEGTLAKLSDAQQADITNRVTQLLLQSGVDVYAFPPRSPFFTFFYAAQMKALGIPPALQGERWPLPERFPLSLLDEPYSWSSPWRISRPSPFNRLLWRGLTVSNVRRHGGKAVDDARRDIIARGLDTTPTD
jgi:hypothetical protein